MERTEGGCCEDLVTTGTRLCGLATETGLLLSHDSLMRRQCFEENGHMKVAAAR